MSLRIQFLTASILCSVSISVYIDLASAVNNVVPSGSFFIDLMSWRSSSQSLKYEGRNFRSGWSLTSRHLDIPARNDPPVLVTGLVLKRFLWTFMVR